MRRTLSGGEGERERKRGGTGRRTTLRSVTAVGFTIMLLLKLPSYAVFFCYSSLFFLRVSLVGEFAVFFFFFCIN